VSIVIQIAVSARIGRRLKPAGTPHERQDSVENSSSSGPIQSSSVIPFNTLIRPTYSIHTHYVRTFATAFSVLNARRAVQAFALLSLQLPRLLVLRNGVHLTCFQELTFTSWARSCLVYADMISFAQPLKHITAPRPTRMRSRSCLSVTPNTASPHFLTTPPTTMVGVLVGRLLSGASYLLVHGVCRCARLDFILDVG
jgi:hypothetical protein